MRHSFYMIVEYFENDDIKLTNTKHTTNILGKGAKNFFIAHIKNKKRYSRLVDFYFLFIVRTVAKMKEIRLPGAAERL